MSFQPENPQQSTEQYIRCDFFLFFWGFGFNESQDRADILEVQNWYCLVLTPFLSNILEKCDKVIFLSDRIDIFCFWPHFYLRILKSGIKVIFLTDRTRGGSFLSGGTLGRLWKFEKLKLHWERLEQKHIIPSLPNITPGLPTNIPYHPKSTQYHPKSTHKYSTSSQVYQQIFHIIPSPPTNNPYHPKSTHKYSISSQPALNQ